MHKFIEVRVIPPPSKKGRGCFARINIRKGTLVEVGYVLLVSNEDYERMADTVVWNYIFEWNGKEEETAAIPLSVCQFINHSYNPNLRYEYDYDNITIEYYAERDIAKGEELTVNYNGIVDDKSPVWFEVEE